LAETLLQIFLTLNCWFGFSVLFEKAAENSKGMLTWKGLARHNGIAQQGKISTAVINTEKATCLHMGSGPVGSRTLM